jgi:uncharacterized protein DUF4389
VAVAPPERPIHLIVREDDLQRSRLTVVFRLLLAIPHFIWLTLWGIAAFTVSFVLWLAVLINRVAPGTLHGFVAGYLRYSTHVGAYIFLAANPYPGFRGRPGYPVDLEIDPPEQQSRWTGFFRLLLALPALILASALGGGLSFGSPSSSWQTTRGDEYAYYGAASIGGVAVVAAFLAWFYILARGRAPRGLRDLTTYALGYGAHACGYLLLLTPRYPSSDPALMDPLPELPEHPIRLEVDDELRRSRLTVFFRLLLAIPHLIWLLLWTIAVAFALVAAWFSTLAIGRLPDALHRFLAAYLRYATHFSAYVYLVGGKFPGFTGTEGSYGIDVHIDAPEKQSRWKTLFRFFLAIPAFLVAGALGGVLLVVAIFAWWFSLITGRMPEGLRNLGASCLRYSSQTYAYFFLLTERYPYATPVLEGSTPVLGQPDVPPAEPPGAPA